MSLFIEDVGAGRAVGWHQERVRADVGVYLEDHPPARQQFRAVRRAAVTGAIVVHTAENVPDLEGADASAENVAAFISRRTDASASYHSVVDSDSIVQVGRYEWEMFHEGTGGNRWSLGLSFACRAAQWPVLPERWFNGALRNGAIEAANMARWVESTSGIRVPSQRITAAQYRSGRAGFVGHGELDPGRRSDPGAGFPWDEFLGLFERAIRPTSGPPDQTESSMLFHQAMADLDELYRAYRGVAPSLAERRAWGRDLAQKIFTRNEDPRPTLVFVEFALRRESER
jgi:hypothetical protein